MNRLVAVCFLLTFVLIGMPARGLSHIVDRLMSRAIENLM